MTLEPGISKREKFIVYETHDFLYVVGCDKRQTEYRILKLHRAVEQPQSPPGCAMEPPDVAGLAAPQRVPTVQLLKRSHY